MYLITFLTFFNFLTSYKNCIYCLIPNKNQTTNLLSTKTKGLKWMMRSLKVFR